MNALIAGSAGQILAATDSGDVRSANNGDTSTQVNTGFTPLSADALAIDPARYVYFGGIERVFRNLRSTIITSVSGFLGGVLRQASGNHLEEGKA